MAQIFPKWSNSVPFILAHIVGPAKLAAVGLVWYYFSPQFTDVGYRPTQPVPFSHQLHAGDLGLDCRYCHASIEKSHEGNVPPTQTCMNCHSEVKSDSPKLALVKESFETGKRIPWVRVHQLPEYAYFDHSVHLKAGVGCLSCHGDVSKMEKVELNQPLSMGWCLECHRDPDKHLRDLTRTKVTDMDWTPPKNQLAFAKRWREEKDINPPQECSACHR